MSRKTFAVDALIEIGNRIKEIRGKRTQAEFGELLGIGRGAVTNYEAGRRLANNEILEKIAALGNVSVNWILTGEQKMKDDFVQKTVNEINKQRDNLVENYLSLKNNFNELNRMGLMLLECVSKEELALIKMLRRIYPFDSRMEVFRRVVEKYEESYQTDQENSEIVLLKETIEKGTYEPGIDWDFRLSVLRENLELFGVKEE